MRRSALLTAVVTAVALAGCGGSSRSSTDSGTSSSSSASASASAADFPASKGQTLESLRKGLPSGPVLAPSTSASLETGTNRVAAALFTVSHKFIPGAQVALYTTDHAGRNARGPYVAHFEPLATKPQFRSKTTAADLDNAPGVYVASVPISKPGKRVILGLAKINGRMYQTTGFELPIPRRGTGNGPPDVGQVPPRIHTLTVTDVNGDASKIDTRVPPATDLLKDDFAKVLGHKPVVITFATPLLCQSRVCGPVVDVLEQVKSQTKGDVAFIHQEIYNDNQVDKGYRPQVAAFRLPSEPWTFVIDRHGRIAARFEGAVGVDELQRAVDAVAAGSS